MTAKWVVQNEDTGDSRTVESRAEAEEVKADMEQLGAEVSIDPPETASDGSGGAEVVEPDETAPRPAQGAYDLPESVPVDTDPLVWMPDEFTDTIDGTVAINRKGFEVICQHFGVAVETSKEIGPWETDNEYAECKATATTPEGRTYTAYGSARADSGDDTDNLLELADTRAYKRAASRATGVGMVAVEEIQGQI